MNKFYQGIAIFIAGAFFAASPAFSQGAADPVTIILGTAPVSGSNPFPISGSFSATLSGFPGSTQTTGTPISVTTGGVTGTLPAGTVVVASNVGATNGAYCKLGGSATTSDQLIPPNSWFAFTVGSNTQLTCITSTSTTTVNMVGGAGLPTGSGGGGGGSGGGGAVTMASGAVASGAYSAGSIAAGAYVSGSILSGALASGAVVDITNVSTPIAPNTATATKSLAIGGVFNTTQETLTNGQQAGVALSARGAQFVAVGADGFAVTNGGTFATQSAITAASGSIASGAVSSGAFASGSIASGAISAGAVAAGAYVSGSVLSGAYASGSLASGAVVDLTNIEGVIGNATAPTKMAVIGGVYNSGGVTLTNGQSASLQFTAAGSAHMTVDNTNANGSATSANSSPVVIASDQAAVAVKAASGAFASGAISSGAIASGAVASGAVASGAYASGSLASGAVVDITNMSAATGAAPPANAIYNGANASGATGGHIKGLIQCDNYVYKHITSATDTLAVQGVASQTIYVCGFHARAAGTATWFLENTASTNANCSSSNTQISILNSEAANTGIVDRSPFWSGLKNTSGNGLCINSTGTGGVDVGIYYAQF